SPAGSPPSRTLSKHSPTAASSSAPRHQAPVGPAGRHRRRMSDRWAPTGRQTGSSFPPFGRLGLRELNASAREWAMRVSQGGQVDDHDQIQGPEDDADELLRRALLDSDGSVAVALRVGGLAMCEALTVVFHGRRDLGTIQTYV